MTTATTASSAYANELRMIIGGEPIGPDARRTLAVHDPATGEEIGRLPIATTEDLERALDSARRGFERWRATSAYDRANVLRTAARLIRERVEPIARILTLEQGKPLAEGRLEFSRPPTSSSGAAKKAGAPTGASSRDARRRCGNW